MAIDLPPPPKLILPAPAIVRPGEPWERDAYRALAPLGLSRGAKHAIVAEIRRVRGEMDRLALRDLARFSSDPQRAMPLVGTFAAASINGLRKKGGTSVATATKVDWGYSASDTATYTFAGKTLGAGHIVVCVEMAAGSAVSISSVTVDGGATTQAVNASYDTGQRACAIYITNAQVSNATGSVVVNLSGTGTNCAIQVYLVTSLNSTTATATATDIASPLSQSITIQAGGFAIACARTNAITTWSWSGLTEDYDYQGSETDTYSSASLNSTPGSTPTAAGTPGSGSNMAMAVAAFR